MLDGDDAQCPSSLLFIAVIILCPLSDHCKIKKPFATSMWLPLCRSLPKREAAYTVGAHASRFCYNDDGSTTSLALLLDFLFFICHDRPSLWSPELFMETHTGTSLRSPVAPYVETTMHYQVILVIFFWIWKIVHGDPHAPRFLWLRKINRSLRMFRPA